jgi:hypothetical protein
MAEKSPEQVLMDEYKRVTRAGATSAPRLSSPSLPSSISMPSLPSSGTPRAVTASSTYSTAARTYSSAAQTVLSSRQVNQGYTLPVPEGTQPAQSSGSSALGTIGSTALKLFTGGLGIVPLISGIAGLFGGGKSSAPPPLVPYAMPRPVSIEAANSPSGSGFQLADYSQTGAARSYAATNRSSNSSSGQAPPAPAAVAGGTSAAAPAAAQGSPQIVVNVSAMDSQSFMDRSGDIAQAVRQAMLSMNSINDVVSEL